MRPPKEMCRDGAATHGQASGKDLWPKPLMKTTKPLAVTFLGRFVVAFRLRKAEHVF